MYIYRKNLIIFTFYAASIIFMSFTANGGQPNIGVTQTLVEETNFYEKYIAIGQCKSENSRTYYAKVNGVVDFIAISEGKAVKRGDKLISIDTAIAEALKSKAESAFKLANTNNKRDLSLLNKNFISRESIDKSNAALENARADLASAMDKYGDMVIRAPFDGKIGVVRTQVGNDLKIGDYLFSLIANDTSTGEKTVLVELPENLNGQIDSYSEVNLLLTNGKKVQGRISAISDYLSDNGTITAKLTFPADTKVVHGSFVECEIIYNHHKGLAINEKSVLKNNKGNFVYKITPENKIKQIYIKTGTRLNDLIEIFSPDLAVGDRIVLEGLTKIFEGAGVELIDNETKESKPENKKE